jgi:hypothetical protein
MAEIAVENRKILIASSDVEGLVRQEFLSQGHHMYQTIYRTVPQRLRVAVRWKRPYKWFLVPDFRTLTMRRVHPRVAKPNTLVAPHLL